jgi:hypothetical protein
LTREQRIERGRHSARLLADEVLSAAHDEAREHFIAEWLGTSDRDRQFAAWAKVKAQDAVFDRLRTYVADGEIAAASSSNP